VARLTGMPAEWSRQHQMLADGNIPSLRCFLVPTG
jgi:hypothetical protein